MKGSELNSMFGEGAEDYVPRQALHAATTALTCASLITWLMGRLST